MALINTISAVKDSLSSMTAYDRFKRDVKDVFNDIRVATNRFMGYDENARPIQVALNDFMNQWAKPAVNDAKSLVQDVATSINPDFKLDSSKQAFTQAVQDISQSFKPAAGGTGSSYSSVLPVEHSARSIDYLNADLAKHYGMDSRAAYSEALQNTAYQRAVRDLKQAGLNPVLAASGFAPAGSYAAGDTLSAGSGSGSSGGYGYGSSAKYAFSTEDYNLIGITGTLVGALVGAKLTPGMKVLGASTGAMLGKQVTQSLAQAVSSTLSKD